MTITYLVSLMSSRKDGEETDARSSASRWLMLTVLVADIKPKLQAYTYH